MLYKVNLKTACGCEKVVFETGGMSAYYKIPLRATRIVCREPGVNPTEAWGVRLFELLKIHKRSSRRTELWYEEVVNG
jgi:hypothetical protein